MAEFKSHYLQLGFYVNDNHKRFDNGRFVTEDKETIQVLSKISDVQRIDEPKIEKAEEPKAKTPAKKTSAK